MKKRSVFALFLLLWLAASALSSCRKNSSTTESDKQKYDIETLKDSLEKIAAEYQGEIGIAVLTDRGDTLTVNNEDKYPLMSVFKLHQAVATCRFLEEHGQTPDTLLVIPRAALNPDTWSPMLKDHTSDTLRLTVKDLMRYTLMQSDNNASNYMFDNLLGVTDVDSFIATLIPRESFRLAVTEAGMWRDHSLCYRNHSSPLGAAMLIDRLFTDSIIGNPEQEMIRTALRECATGTDRIVAPLAEIEGVTVAHKTGSGFRDADGILTAHNDVAFITLPDGRHYTLAVLVKDFHGDEKGAASAIARISATVYACLSAPL